MTHSVTQDQEKGASYPYTLRNHDNTAMAVVSDQAVAQRLRDLLNADDTRKAASTSSSQA